MTLEKKKDELRYDLAYQQQEIALRYRGIYAERLNIKNASSKAVAFRERSIIKRILKICNIQDKGLLDIPCGAGKLASVCSDFSVLAADISITMMSIAKKNYTLSKHFKGLTVVCLRLLHRVPPHAWGMILRELAEISDNYVIISFGIEGKHAQFRQFLKKLFKKKTGRFPLYLTPYSNIKMEIEKTGLKIIRSFKVFPLIYHEVILLLKKNELAASV